MFGWTSVSCVFISLIWNVCTFVCTPQGENLQHIPNLWCQASSAEANMPWAINEARKIGLRRSLISIARPAGEVLLGSVTYAERFSVDSIVQVRNSMRSSTAAPTLSIIPAT